MIAAGASQKLRFTIAYCSGEDYDYPARELLFHNPQTRGWQSPRTCKYPQEIILQLEQPSAIQQIQMLSHEYKIASKVEVFVGEQSIRDPGFSPSSMKRLGYLSFDSNERSGHQARELKSVTVNVNALIFKFVIHRCHANKLNIYNQVGIIAVNLIGEPLQPAGALGYLEVGAPGGKQPYYNKAAAAVADLNLDLHVDPHTAGKIRELQRQKEGAIEAEDYDEAKRLKVSIERLKVIGQKIQQLESRKRAAVEKEDYDLAKTLKSDIDKLRLAGESAAVSVDGAAVRSRNPDDIFNRVLERDRSAQGLPPGAVPVDRSAEGPRGVAQGAGGGGGGYGGLGLAQDIAAARISDTGAPSPSQQQPSHNPAAMGPPGWPSPDNPTSYIAYDERPTNGRGTYDVDASPPEAAAAAPGRPSRTTLDADEQTISSHPPPGWPSDLPPPEVLAGPAAAQAGELVELAGEYAGTSFLSRNWQLREAATSYVTGLLRQGRLADRKDAYRTLLKAIVRGLKDRVPNVFHSAVGLLKQLLDTFASSATQRELASVAEQCVPVLLEKTGDANTRIKEAARVAIMDLAAVKDAGLRGMTGVFVRPVKNQSAWKPVLGTLQLLQELVPLLGISKTGEGFEAGELMEYVGKALNSANAEVRSAAVRVAATAHELVGPPVRKLLPRDLNPKMKEQLDAAFGGEAPPAPPAARPVSATTRPAAATNRPAAAPKANHANGSAARAAPPAAAPLPALPAAGPLVDTPAAYEAEIRQREVALGANHPEVAALCSHLAILYAQEENMRGAQSAYERALRIYEAALGPEHPDVAHTLTDLAVLHLEQGRDTEGRPLLERALVIQEKLLGPDHPDVVAIRDVLNSDE